MVNSGDSLLMRPVAGGRAHARMGGRAAHACARAARTREGGHGRARHAHMRRRAGGRRRVGGWASRARATQSDGQRGLAALDGKGHPPSVVVSAPHSQFSPWGAVNLFARFWPIGDEVQSPDLPAQSKDTCETTRLFSDRATCDSKPTMSCLFGPPFHKCCRNRINSGPLRASFPQRGRHGSNLAKSTRFGRRGLTAPIVRHPQGKIFGIQILSGVRQSPWESRCYTCRNLFVRPHKLVLGVSGGVCSIRRVKEVQDHRPAARSDASFGILAGPRRSWLLVWGIFVLPAHTSRAVFG